jgi:hypothetical protein
MTEIPISSSSPTGYNGNTLDKREKKVIPSEDPTHLPPATDG